MRSNSPQRDVRESLLQGIVENISYSRKRERHALGEIPPSFLPLDDVVGECYV